MKMETKKEIYRTGLKCKNCGYDVVILKVFGKVSLFHTGTEESLGPNYYCSMAHSGDTSTPNTATVGQKHAELSKEDMGKILEMLWNEVEALLSGGRNGN